MVAHRLESLSALPRGNIHQDLWGNDVLNKSLIVLPDNKDIIFTG